MVETFKMNDLTLALLNETWLYKSDKQVQKQLKNIKDEFGLDIIRKDRNSRGGGVAVAFNSNELLLKN